ncbi:MAG: HK97 family phage prohead protease [Chloroflexi bacterium]|nr:HK97 family phage prohead protease [Chloroflexota bacterium]
MKRKPSSKPNKTEFKYALIGEPVVDARVIKQLFAIMGNRDEGGDIIHPGAFAKTIAEHLPDIKVLWQHDSFAPPIGVPNVLKEITLTELPVEILAKYPTATGGLYSEVEYLETERGNEVYTGIIKKAIIRNSIGYRTVKADFGTDADGNPVRNLRELMLLDLSPVNWGMNSATLNLKAAFPFRDTGIDEDRAKAWTVPTLEDFTDQSWDDLSDEDIKRIAGHFASTKSTPPESFADLMFPHHAPSKDGEGKAIWSGVSAAMDALIKCDDLSDEDMAACHEHLAKHYEQFKQDAPLLKSVIVARHAFKTSILVADLQTIEDFKAGRMISAANMDRMQSAMDAIQEAMQTLRTLMKEADSGKTDPVVAAVSQAEMERLAMRLRLVGSAIRLPA